MNRLLSSLKGIFNKTVNSGSSASRKLINIIKAKITLSFLGPIIAPLLLIFILFLVIVSMFNEKLNLLQMVDSSGGGRSSISGKGIYTLNEFEDAVNVGNTSFKGGSYGDFVSSLTDSSFKNVDGFNEFIKANVEKAGWGTREGVVAAAMALCYELPKETNWRYFYHYENGVNPRHGIDGVTPEVILDCRSFVQWAVYNGGFKAEELSHIGKYGVANIAPVKDDFRTAQPGDIISTYDKGHTWLVVAVDEKGYYAAEEYSGAEVNYYTFDQPWGNYYGAKLYDMSSYYDNPDNVRSP